MGYTTVAATIKSAKKDHICDWCGEAILTGAQYDRWRWYELGSARTVKSHPECMAAVQESDDQEGEEFDRSNPRGCI